MKTWKSKKNKDEEAMEMDEEMAEDMPVDVDVMEIEMDTPEEEDGGLLEDPMEGDGVEEVKEPEVILAKPDEDEAMQMVGEVVTHAPPNRSPNQTSVKLSHIRKEHTKSRKYIGRARRH